MKFDEIWASGSFAPPHAYFLKAGGNEKNIWANILLGFGGVCWDYVSPTNPTFSSSFATHWKLMLDWVGLCFHLVRKVGPCWSVFLNQIKNTIQQIWLMFHNTMLSSSFATFLTLYPWRNDVPNKQIHEKSMHDLNGVFVSSLWAGGWKFHWLIDAYQDHDYVWNMVLPEYKYATKQSLTLERIDEEMPMVIFWCRTSR